MSDLQTDNRNDIALRKPRGQHYLSFLEDMHASLSPEWYLEIGTNTGSSLTKSRTRSVCVDPNFVLAHDVWSALPELHLHQTTSDAFFAQGHLDRLGAEFDLAFLDGMHLYEFLLRDFMNTERYMAPNGRIVMHDCVPRSENIAQRDRSKVQGNEWTGDVWKVLPILKRYRPDLNLQVFDAARTGLVVVDNLDPNNRVLQENYSKIRSEFDARSDLGATLQSIEVLPTSAAHWRRVAASKTKSLHFAIKSPAPTPEKELLWGDTHFAVGLQNALRRQGHSATVRTRQDWQHVERDDEIDLVISGGWAHPRRPNRLTLQWLISTSEPGDSDHIFAAGQPLLDKLRSVTPQLSCSLLPQAFDADRMPLPAIGGPRHGILFVGTSRNGRRALVNYALDSDVTLEIWGPGWGETAFAKFHCGEYLDNTKLGLHYATAEIVLNDHKREMRRNGIASNRIFDALACGSPVISDPVSWLSDDIAPFVDRVGSTEEFVAALARICAETDEMRKARYDFAVKMRQQHSFDARAKEILRIVNERLGRSA